MKMNVKMNPWSWKELLYLLLLTLVAVPAIIEYGLFHYLLGLFENELYAGTATGFAMSLIFLGGLYLIVLKPNHQSWKAFGVQSFAIKHWKFILWWTVILIVASILIVVGMSFLGIGTANSKTESLQSQMTLLNFVIAFVSAAIISPVYEEIFYRGFLYRFFSSRFGIIAGLLISSTIFTIVHIPTYNTLPVNFVSGLIFAWAFQKTGSVIPGIIIHGAFNGLAVILTSFA